MGTKQENKLLSAAFEIGLSSIFVPFEENTPKPPSSSVKNALI